MDGASYSEIPSIVAKLTDEFVGRKRAPQLVNVGYTETVARRAARCPRRDGLSPQTPRGRFELCDPGGVFDGLASIVAQGQLCAWCWLPCAIRTFTIWTVVVQPAVFRVTFLVYT